MSRTWGKRRTAAVAAVALVAAGGGGSAWALRRSSDGVSYRYKTTAEMAAKMGCAGTYRQEVVFAGILDAGTCTVAGDRIDLRVLKDTDTALAWSEGTHLAEAETHYSAIGDGWVARTKGRGAAGDAITRLTGP